MTGRTLYDVRLLPLAKITQEQTHNAQDELWRFMRPALTDEERIPTMANALRQWCATVDYERARHVVYAEIGITGTAAERLDVAALRHLQTMLEKEKAA